MRTPYRTTAIAILAIMAGAGEVEGQRRTSWSADGRTLALTLGEKDSGGVFVVAASGGRPRRVYASGKRESFPSWLPSGQIVFASTMDGHSNLYVVSPDGSGLRQLTRDAGENSYPSPSPDGKRLAFMSNRSGRWQLFVANADASSPRQITHTQGNEYNPEWSHDGRRIVFESDRHGGDQDEIYLIDASGQHEQRLTASALNEIFPAWSPDGTRIAYCVVEKGRASIRVMAAGGFNQRTLMQDACLPSWSPDGRSIAFERESGEAGIYIMDVAGGALRRVVP